MNTMKLDLTSGRAIFNFKTEEKPKNKDIIKETMMRIHRKDSSRLGKRLSTPGYAGVDSYRVFYQKYKNIDKELEEDKEGYSASTAYLQKLKYLKMVPSPLGLIRHQGKDNTIQANNLKMGQQYALALSNSMKHLSNTQAIELPGNRLGDKGAVAILENLSDRVRTINLDNNKIGQDGIMSLTKWIDQMNVRCQLESLSLEGNNLNCQITEDLIHAIDKAMPPLKYLNLSKNNIGDKGGIAIAHLMTMCYHLKIVKISWNKITGKGGIAIADGLKENQ